jgi:hypothetical protein
MMTAPRKNFERAWRKRLVVIRFGLLNGLEKGRIETVLINV